MKKQNNLCAYLHADGKKIVDGSGKEILLSGWGLGNWLLQEGYMWKAYGERFDRPSRIEKCVEELTGKDYAPLFWKKYRENYIRREDILAMAELGYNSVRIPFSYRLFMEDGPGILWKEEGFKLLDDCLSWCEEAGIYAFLDLHGAPGGQTGSNIDDSVDNVPRLFIDRDCRVKACALWKKLAQRYSERAVVGGYDLLNEPIIPPEAGNGDFDYLIPELELFYEEVIAAVREVDNNHLISLEGAHWATDVRIFHKKYDDNMVLHFHRYAEMPDRACLERFISAAEELDVPLWMGETGENSNAWYAALYPLASALGIGYNLWPWKKMDCTNSPCSIREPEGYQKILRYLDKGPHPGYEEARQILNQYLENICIENCELHPEVTRHVFRKPPFTIQAVDFDACPGKGASWFGSGNPYGIYRSDTDMEIRELYPAGEKAFAFDCGWECLALVLKAGEFVCYSFCTAETAGKEIHLQISYRAEEKTELAVITETGKEVLVSLEPGTEDAEVSLGIPAADMEKGTVRLEGRSGSAWIKQLIFT